MSILQLRDPGVRRAMQHPALTGRKKLARGSFCAVYDAGDTVLKLTCDAKQYALYADYTAPTGDYFPRLVENHGHIGETSSGLSIYLVEMEKLDRVGRDAPLETKRLARQLLNSIEEPFDRSLHRHVGGRVPIVEAAKRASIEALDAVSEDESLPEDLRDSLADLGVFVSNYDCSADFHMANLMRRGNQLVLNDVVTDIATFKKHSARFKEIA